MHLQPVILAATFTATPTSATGATRLHAGADLETITVEINLDRSDFSHKILINQVLKSADFIDIVSRFFFIIDGHRYGRTASAAFL